MRLSGKKVVVTGGTGALGRVLVEMFAREGADIALPVRLSPPQTALGLWSPEIRTRVTPLTCDVARPEAVDAFVKALGEQWSTIDILVHAAGGYAGGDQVDATPIEDWERMVSLNLTSAFLFSRAVVPFMRQRRTGRIVFIAALSALRPSSLRGAYAVSKRGIISLMEVLTDELRSTDITVNAIAPGTIVTEANKSSMPDGDVGSWVPPEEIASMALFLCSDEGRNVRGTTIQMTGRER